MELEDNMEAKLEAEEELAWQKKCEAEGLCHDHGTKLIDGKCPECYVMCDPREYEGEDLSPEFLEAMKNVPSHDEIVEAWDRYSV